MDMITCTMAKDSDVHQMLPVRFVHYVNWPRNAPGILVVVVNWPHQAAEGVGRGGGDQSHFGYTPLLRSVILSDV